MEKKQEEARGRGKKQRKREKAKGVFHDRYRLRATIVSIKVSLARNREKWIRRFCCRTAANTAPFRQFPHTPVANDFCYISGISEAKEQEKEKEGENEQTDR